MNELKVSLDVTKEELAILLRLLDEESKKWDKIDPPQVSVRLLLTLKSLMYING